MAKPPSSISPAELTVLKVLWDSRPLTVRDVCDALESEKQGWAYTTVQTLLNRLAAKGVVQREADGVAHRYRPALSRNRLLASRLKELAEQLCDGATSPLLSALVDTHRFTTEELAGFRKLLDEREESGPGNRPKKKTRTPRR